MQRGFSRIGSRLSTVPLPLAGSFRRRQASHSHSLARPGWDGLFGLPLSLVEKESGDAENILGTQRAIT